MTENLKQMLRTMTRPRRSQSSDQLVGQMLGAEYKLLELLGQGAMARVYKATHLTLDRTVAIKILTSPAPDLVARFVHEIKVHSLLKHNNIVEALDCVTDARTGQACFVMEFLAGDSLQHVIRGNPEGLKSEEDIYFVISHVASALNYAHRQGVIHRDLKPANMVFVETGDGLQVKVVDFGMARLQEQVQRFTKTGHIVGSPLYMSPEQCMGKELDPRSDVYSLALVTYEMATGKAPFAGVPTLYDVMQSHCDPDTHPEPVSAKNENLRLCKRLDQIILVAMETNPDSRFQTVKHFEEALRVWHEAVKKGMSEEELDLIPINRGEPPQSDQRVATGEMSPRSALSNRSGALLRRSGRVEKRSKEIVSVSVERAKLSKFTGKKEVMSLNADPATTYETDETKARNARAAAAAAFEKPKANWRIPEMITTHHGGGWGVVPGQELGYIRQCEPLVGKILNRRYRVQQLIGEGGMSIVYRAQDQETGKMVAIKALKFVDEDLARRFTREINLHMELKHPNIVKAIERITLFNQTLFVMELLEGTVLEDFLEREFRVSSFNDICSIVAQLCDALEFAHDQDIIHRDLKPGNVMLIDQAGTLRVKVLDFGLAQIQDDLQRMTRTGVLVGSPGYMSPEHCLGKDLTCQSDIYSLGVLAFEIMAGELPFQAETDIEMVKAHCDKALIAMPISRFRQDLPALEVLEKVLARAMEKETGKRYQLVEEFRRDLDGWWQAAGGQADESPFRERRRRRRKARAVVGIESKDAPPVVAAAEPSAAQKKEDLSSIVDNFRQGQVQTVTSKWRGDPRMDRQSASTIKMIVITIVIFCFLGTLVLFSLNSKKSAVDKQETATMVESKPEESAASEPAPVVPFDGRSTPDTLTSQTGEQTADVQFPKNRPNPKKVGGMKIRGPGQYTVNP